MAKRVGRKAAVRDAQGAQEGPREGEEIAKVLQVRQGGYLDLERATGQIATSRIPAQLRQTIWIRKGCFVVAMIDDEAGTADTITSLQPKTLKRLVREGDSFPERFAAEIAGETPETKQEWFSSDEAALARNPNVDSEDEQDAATDEEQEAEEGGQGDTPL